MNTAQKIVTSSAVNSNVATTVGRGRRPTEFQFTVEEIENAVHIDIRQNGEKFEYFTGGKMIDDGFGEQIYVAGNQLAGKSIHETFVEHNVKRGRFAKFANQVVCVHYEGGKTSYVKTIAS